MFYLVFAFGLIFGSFLNVIIYRLNSAPQLRGGVFGRSFCPHCQTQLKWHDLVPVLSFIYLGGYCRYCRRKISWQYPVVEILSGLVWVSVFFKVYDLRFQTPYSAFQALDFIYYIFTFSSLLVIAVYDFKWEIIPDKIVYPVIALVLIFNLFNAFKLLNFETFVTQLFVALTAFSFFFLIYFFSKGRAMGFGDGKLAFLIGLFLSPILAAAAFTLAFVVGATFGIILVGLGEKTLKSQIAFGPFLVSGVFIAFFFSNFIIKFVNF